MLASWHPARRRPDAHVVPIAILAGLFSFSHTSGQTLRLPNSSPLPDLPRVTAASELWASLEAEAIELIDEERNAAGSDQIVLRARINLRIISADLLMRGDDIGKEGSLAITAGQRLAQLRTAIDDTLVRVLSTSTTPVSPAGLDASQRALVRFNDAVLELVRLPIPRDVQTLDANLHILLNDLATALELLTTTTMHSHWPSESAVIGTVSTQRGSVESVARLRERIQAVHLPENTRLIFADVAQFLDEGVAFADLRPAIEKYLRLLSRALDFAETISEATWLRDSQHERYQTALHTATALFRDRQTRAQGIAQLNRLDETRLTIRRINVLAGKRVDLKPIHAAMEDVEALLGGPAAEAIDDQRLARLRFVLDRMIAFRELPDVPLKRELRQATRRLRAAYFQSESKLVHQIGRLATDADALADPAFLTLIADQKQSLDDIRRLQLVPTWLGRAQGIQPVAVDGLARQFRKMARWLGDPNRRPDASRALAQFEHQLELFESLPYEDALSQPGPSLLAATGGHHQEVLVSIQEARRGWIDAWARGDASGSAADRMIQVYRLTRTLGQGGRASRCAQRRSSTESMGRVDTPRGRDRPDDGQIGEPIEARQRRGCRAG